MQVQIERDIYIRGARCYELLTKSIQSFKDYLGDRVPPNDPMYYKARNLLKEGKAFFDQTLADAKKLLGPIPVYAPKDFEQSRSRLLVENKIIVLGRTLEALTAELQDDDFVRTIMTPAEVADYTKAHFAAQSSGKRKLQNIKIRMALDKLASLYGEGLEFQKRAQQKEQGLPF